MHPLRALPPRTPSDDPVAARFDFQCRMLEKGLAEVQHQVGRLDEIAFRIQAGAATVWAALVGWAYTTMTPELVELAFLVILGFWLLEGMFRGVQARYIVKARDLSLFLNDEAALDRCFQARALPAGMVYPVSLREGEGREALRFLRGLTRSTVATLYLFLGLANVLALLAMDLAAARG